MTLRSRLAELLHPLRASREELDAADEARGATRRGTVPIGRIVPRHRARVSGVLRERSGRRAARRRNWRTSRADKLSACGAR